MRSELKVSGFDVIETSYNDVSFHQPVWEPSLTLGEGAGLTNTYLISDSVAGALVECLTKTTELKTRVLQWKTSVDLLIKKYGSGKEVYFHYVAEDAERSPLLLMDEVKVLTEQHYPKHEFDSVTINCSSLFEHSKAKRIRLRVVLGAVLACSLSQSWNSQS